MNFDIFPNCGIKHFILRHKSIHEYGQTFRLCPDIDVIGHLEFYTSSLDYFPGRLSSVCVVKSVDYKKNYGGETRSQRMGRTPSSEVVGSSSAAAKITMYCQWPINITLKILINYALLY